MTGLYEDSFGYVPIAEPIRFSLGAAEPLPVIQEAIASVTSRANRDGYLYPPLVHTRRVDLHSQETEVVPTSERPALLHRLPATHSLQLTADFETPDDARRGAAGFIIHFLGFVHGFRCQFHDWWMDGRVAIKPEIDHTQPSPTEVGALLDAALKRWRGFSPRQKTVAINILFLHSRAPLYEWDWERFQAEYQILDAVFALARDTGKGGQVKEVSHAGRIEWLCKEFGIPMDLHLIKQMVGLRNELIHEVLWDGRMPGDATSDVAFRAASWLHDLSKRAMLAALGLGGPYIESSWWSRGVVYFGVHP